MINNLNTIPTGRADFDEKNKETYSCLQKTSLVLEILLAWSVVFRSVCFITDYIQTKRELSNDFLDYPLNASLISEEAGKKEPIPSLSWHIL